MGCSSSANNHVNVAVPMEKEQREQIPKTFHETYFLGPKLGRGAFAQVRVATLSGSGKDQKPVARAVKIIDLREKANPSENSRQQQKAAQSEAAIWKAVGAHANVIRLHDVFWGQQLCYLVMEKCACSLLSALESTPEFNEATLSRVVVQMFQGLAHVHAARIIHRDVKPDNFLCGGENGYTVKLGDFGLSAALPKVGGVSGVFGTAPFMCPEMLAGRWYNEKADVWSVAVIAYVLLFGNFPYMPKEQSSKGMKQAILDGQPAPKYEPAGRHHQQLMPSKNAVTFCKTLLNRDPDRRPTSCEALTMPYMLQASDDEQVAPFPEILPSLRPMLHAAKKVGAFEVRDPSRDDRTDNLLNSLQMKHLGVPLPATLPPSRSDRHRDDARKKTDDSRTTKDTTFSNGSKGKKSLTPPPGTAWENSSVTTRSTACGSSDRDDWSFRGSGWSKGSSAQAGSAFS
mmetsp:Transcript_28140/g.49053  ORF Transcript_28140/g.49053 Transcript_28140/m.49053 type:complete len:457 (+) Transcript_28140:80-1450(+)